MAEGGEGGGGVKKLLTVVQVLASFPLMLVGILVGFVCMSLYAGWLYGEKQFGDFANEMRKDPK